MASSRKPKTLMPLADVRTIAAASGVSVTKTRAIVALAEKHTIEALAALTGEADDSMIRPQQEEEQQ